MIQLLLLCLFSITFGDNLDNWINEKSKLVNNSNYKISFDYLLKDKKITNSDESQKEISQHLDFFSINSDLYSEILKINNRYVIFHSEYSEIIDENSKQRFLDKKDEEFINMKNKVLSIFFDKNFKIIKLSKAKYLLSLDDYYLNINFLFNDKENFVEELSFTENAHLVNVNNLSITEIDSVSFNYDEWNSYQVIDLR
jgi:hypothetical protein